MSLHDELLELATTTARSAARLIESGAARGVEVAATKSSSVDVVTESDRSAERLIRRTLLDARPDDAVLGEEGDDQPGTSGVRWIVDPIDGTVNFLYGIPHYAVSIAASVDGEPVAGVVHAPLLSRTYAARKGGGAFRDERRIHVSGRRPEQAIVATGFPFRRKELLPVYEPAFGAALHRFEDIRRVGGASLDLCWTAEGVFDGYFELRLGPWAVAAGGIIVREAGGVVSDWAGDASDWLISGDIIAGPPDVHAVLAEIVSAGD